MNRRGFFALLGALGAAPVIGRIARLVPAVERAYQSRILYVGEGQEFATLSAALKAACAGAGDTIYILPHHVETVYEPMDVTGMRIVGGKDS